MRWLLCEDEEEDATGLWSDFVNCMTERYSSTLAPLRFVVFSVSSPSAPMSFLVIDPAPTHMGVVSWRCIKQRGPHEPPTPSAQVANRTRSHHPGTRLVNFLYVSIVPGTNLYVGVKVMGPSRRSCKVRPSSCCCRSWSWASSAGRSLMSLCEMRWRARGLGVLVEMR